MLTIFLILGSIFLLLLFGEIIFNKSSVCSGTAVSKVDFAYGMLTVYRSLFWHPTSSNRYTIIVKTTTFGYLWVVVYSKGWPDIEYGDNCIIRVTKGGLTGIIWNVKLLK